MAKKSKKFTLTKEQRLSVLQDLKTLSTKTIAAKYQVSKTTIRNIYNGAKINGEGPNLYRNKYQELDELLQSWYEERRSRCDFLSNELLVERMNTLAAAIGYEQKPGNSWLRTFKQRHNIDFRDKWRLRNETQSINENLPKVILDGAHVYLEHIYNIHETILLWKALPPRTNEGEGEENINGYKLNKEKIVLCLCANLSGTHRIKPLVINNYTSSGDLRDHMHNSHLAGEQEKITQKNADLFADWYKNDFKRSCKKHQLQNALIGKVYLLLEYCSRIRLTDGESDEFKILCLSGDSPFNKRINEDVIEAMKRRYRYRLMNKSLKYPNEEEFYQNHSIKDCVHMIMQSWVDVLGNRNKARKRVNVTKRIREEMKDEGTEDGTILTKIRDVMALLSKQNTTIQDVISFLTECHMEEQNIGSEIGEESRREINENVEEDREESDDSERLVIDESYDQDRDEINEDGNEESSMEETNDQPSEAGIELQPGEREEVEYCFQRLEYYCPRMPLGTDLHFQACKSAFLGTPRQ